MIVNVNKLESLLFAFLILTCIIYENKIKASNDFEDDFAEFDSHPDIDTVKQAESRIDASGSKEKASLQSAALKDDQSNSNNLDKDSPSLKASKEPSNRILKLVDAPLPKVYTWETYYIEILFLVTSVLFFINYFVGSSKNEQLAIKWYDQAKEVLKNHFALVGGSPIYHETSGKKSDQDGEESTKSKKQKGLIKISDSAFTSWCSGRVGLDGLMLQMDLLKRQDLFSMAFTLIRPSKDVLILRYSLNQDGYDNFVFCLANKTSSIKMAAEMIDIGTFCPKRKPASTFGIDSEKFFVLAEISDAAIYLLDKSTVSFINKCQNCLNFIHITDRYSLEQSEEASPAQRLSGAKRMATFSFALQDTLEVGEIIDFSLTLVDKLKKFKLSKDGKQKSEKNRQKITEILQKTAFTQRQEANQAKKEELRRKEKERIYNEENPEKQRRYELKEAKRERKQSKNQKKIKMVMFR